jgi:hypothetical protein
MDLDDTMIDEEIEIPSSSKKDKKKSKRKTDTVSGHEKPNKKNKSTFDTLSDDDNASIPPPVAVKLEPQEESEETLQNIVPLQPLQPSAQPEVGIANANANANAHANANGHSNSNGHTSLSLSGDNVITMIHNYMIEQINTLFDFIHTNPPSCTVQNKTDISSVCIRMGFYRDLLNIIKNIHYYKNVKKDKVLYKKAITELAEETQYAETDMYNYFKEIIQHLNDEKF